MSVIIDPYLWHEATIIKIVSESAEAVSLQLDLGGQDYDFACGQHTVVRVTLPDGSRVMRQYSFASAPGSQEIWLTVIHTPAGLVSGWFTQTARVGDRIEISQPFTGPLVQDLADANICMIAGGSGIAPLMSHLRARHSQHRLTTLLYSTRSESRCYENELASLTDHTIHVRLTDMQHRLSQEDIDRYCADSNAVLICGSRQFVDSMRHYVRESFPQLPIHAEAFSLT